MVKYWTKDVKSSVKEAPDLHILRLNASITTGLPRISMHIYIQSGDVLAMMLHQLFLTAVCLLGARSCYLFTESKEVEQL